MLDKLSGVFESVSQMGPVKLTNIFSGVTFAGLFGTAYFFGGDISHSMAGPMIGATMLSFGAWLLSGMSLSLNEGDVYAKGQSYKDTKANTMDKQSYASDNHLIDAGKVRLNAISPYLADLPDTATANLLVAKHDLANIDGGRVKDTWINSMSRIENIRDYLGFDGMKLSGGDTTKYYEEVWADKVRGAFFKALKSGEEVRTGLFMPTLSLAAGNGSGTEAATEDGAVTRRTLVDGLLQDKGYPARGIVENNMFAHKNMISAQGSGFQTSGGDISHYYTMTQPNTDSRGYYSKNYWAKVVDFAEGSVRNSLNGMMRNDRHRDKDYHSARPVALAIQP